MEKFINLLVTFGTVSWYHSAFGTSDSTRYPGTENQIIVVIFLRDSTSTDIRYPATLDIRPDIQLSDTVCRISGKITIR